MTDQECFEAAKRSGLAGSEFSAWRHFLYLYAAEIERVAVEKEKARVLRVISEYRDASLSVLNGSMEKPEGESCKAIVETLNLIMRRLSILGCLPLINDDGETSVDDHVPDSGKMIKQLESAMHRITKLDDQVAALERRIQGLERCEQARQPIGSPGQNGWPGWPAWTGPYQAPNIWVQAESKVDLAKVHGLSK